MKKIKVAKEMINALRQLAFDRSFRRRIDERFNFVDYVTFMRED